LDTEYSCFPKPWLEKMDNLIAKQLLSIQYLYPTKPNMERLWNIRGLQKLTIIQQAFYIGATVGRVLNRPNYSDLFENQEKDLNTNLMFTNYVVEDRQPIQNWEEEFDTRGCKVTLRKLKQIGMTKLQHLQYNGSFLHWKK